MKSSDMCQFQFQKIFRIDNVQKKLKGSKMGLPFFHTYHIIIQTYKLTIISPIFNVHLFIMTKILFFHFYGVIVIIPLVYPYLVFLLFVCTYDSALTMYFKLSLVIGFVSVSNLLIISYLSSIVSISL